MLAVVLFGLRKVADVCYGLLFAAVFLVYKADFRTALKSLRFMFDPPYPSEKRYRAFYLRMKTQDRQFYKRINVMQEYRRRTPTRYGARLLFKAVADPNQIIWVRAEVFTYKTNYDLNLYYNDILPGDWDCGPGIRRLSSEKKHLSIIQHFRDGTAWEDTWLFKSNYIPKLERGKTVWGGRTLSDLKRYYETNVDGLHKSIKQNGFIVEFDAHGSADIPHVHIGRDGTIVLGSNGNHRIPIAILLGVERVPCYVRARHLEWQLVREKVATMGAERCLGLIGRDIATHPDLKDLV